jgi:hypothetical protein
MSNGRPHERFLWNTARTDYFDNCCNANAHSRAGSRSPAFANSIISLATAMVPGSLRSTTPSLRKAASNAADVFAMSSGPNE